MLPFNGLVSTPTLGFDQGILLIFCWFEDVSLVVLTLLFTSNCIDGDAQAIPSSPYGKQLDICVSKNGVPVTVGGFPSTPYVLTPFKDIVTNPVDATRQGIQCRSDGHCMHSFEFDVKDVTLRPFDNVIAGCKAQGPTSFLTYGGTIPAATITMPAGHESIVRFNNKINSVNGFYAGSFAPCSGSRTGRPFSTHFHGSASLAPFDGWADCLSLSLFCYCATLIFTFT